MNKPIDKDYLTRQFTNFKNANKTTLEEGNIISSENNDIATLPKLGENYKWLKLNEEKIYQTTLDTEPNTKGYIAPGMYSQIEFWNLIKQFVPRGTFRACTGTFTVTVERHPITQTNGYIVSSDLYNRPTTIIFCPRAEDLDFFYQGYDAQNPQLFEETRAYIANVDMSKPQDMNIGEEYGFPIKIDGGIIFN